MLLLTLLELMVRDISLAVINRALFEMYLIVMLMYSTGDCGLEGTPHFRSGDSGMNDYEWCMGVLAESLRKYNSEPQIPLWGFGAQFNGTPYHIFQCGSSSVNNGSRELLNAYKSTFHTAMEFGYETRYNEVIQAAAHHSKKCLVRKITYLYASYP